MADDYKFKALTMDHLKEACHNMSESFTKASSIYIKRESTYEQIYPVYYYEMKESIKHNLTFGVFFQDKIVAAIIVHDMYDYPKMENKAWLEGHSKIVSYERRFVQQIESDLLQLNYERGVAAYGIYNFTLPEHASKGVGIKLAIELVKQLKRRGYKKLYGTTTSDKAFNQFGRVGGVPIREMHCEQPEMKGEKYSFGVINLDKIIQTHKVPKKAEIKPKL